MPLIVQLAATYELNNALAGLGMTPNPDSSFCRLPSPKAFDHPGDTYASDVAKLTYLPLTWQAILFHLPQARIYDSTVDGLSKFAEATGLLPSRFARLYSEAPNNAWCHFHPRLPQGGSAVMSAMCVSWAEKVQRWRAIADDDAVQTSIIARMGQELFDHVKTGWRLC